jgi:hypothetical protein
MRNKFTIISAIAICIAIVTIVHSCAKEVLPTPPKAVNNSLTEEFDTVANLYAKGWIFNNRSTPIGTATWQQGLYDVGKLGPEGFPAFSYKAKGDEYMFAGFNANFDLGQIDSWMITPALTMKNGDQISFYTRTSEFSDFPDRMQVRLNLTDDSYAIGSGVNSVGNFTTLLVDINPTLSLGGYPEAWTKYTFIVSGLPAPLKRRVAFRYLVSDGGPGGANSNGIGIDLFKFESL